MRLIAHSTTNAAATIASGTTELTLEWKPRPKLMPARAKKMIFLNVFLLPTALSIKKMKAAEKAIPAMPAM